MAWFLVVDDEPDIGLVLRLNLEEWGHDVTVVTSAADAYAVCAGESRPDAMLVDVSMPGESGVELIRRLREDGCAPPQLALLTAATRSQALPIANELGVRLLTKPFHLSDLRDLADTMAAGG